MNEKLYELMEVARRGASTVRSTAADAAVSETPPTIICRDMADVLAQLQSAYREQEELP